jgi:hypothetical protein
MLSSGFKDALVSRSLVFGIVATSLLVSITDNKYYFYIQVEPHLWRYHQLWRILIYQLCYTNSSEVLFAAMTLYNLRVIERLWGSRKFAVSTSKIIFLGQKLMISKYLVLHTLMLPLHNPPPASAARFHNTPTFL